LRQAAAERAGDVWDGWIELVDPITGQVIARRSFDDVLIDFVPGSGYVSLYREDAAGTPLIDLFRMSLVHPPDPR
jgi:hypothetical protein